MSVISDSFDKDWEDAVEGFDGGETDEEFMSALRDMVGGLQAKAFNMGLEAASRRRVSVRMSEEDSRFLILALLEGKSLDIGIEPWQGDE